MPLNTIKTLFISALFNLILLFNVNVIFGQCGIPGTPPCATKTRTTAVKKSPTKKNTRLNTASKNNNPITKNNSDSSSNIRKTSFPILADVEIPGYSGIIVENLDGAVVLDSYSNFPFNPASNVKIATAYAVLKSFGPDYRFPTSFWTDGKVDLSTGTLYGNLYVSGRDPMFNYEHAIAIAAELNRVGIRSVAGDLIVTDNFAFNYNGQATNSGQALLATMSSAKRSPAATRAWKNYLTTAKKRISTTDPNLEISGGVYVQKLPTNATLLFSHESVPMREILKVTLCYSNNFIAERLGDMLGGPYAVARSVQTGAQVAPEEFYIQTASGLGINRVTPRAMIKLLRALRNDLHRNRMSFTDIMPVAGIDKGTLEDRFNTNVSIGSVVGVTGAMANTDGGVSTLSGEFQTKNGKLLFVFFNNKGNLAQFRAFQNSLISLIQGLMGGASPISYNEIALDTRLANTRITYPDAQVRSQYPVYNQPAPEQKTKRSNEDNSPFQAEYIGGDGPPIVEVINSSDRTLNLKIGVKQYTIPAGTSESIILEPGENAFTASAVRVRTLSSSRNFERGYRYTWKFRIVTGTR